MSVASEKASGSAQARTEFLIWPVGVAPGRLLWIVCAPLGLMTFAYMFL